MKNILAIYLHSSIRTIALNAYRPITDIKTHQNIVLYTIVKIL
jgi:hypothetical protein